MSLPIYKMHAFLLAMTVPIVSAFANNTKTDDERIARLEVRLSELESKLLEIEGNTFQSVSKQSGSRIAELEIRLANAEREVSVLKQQIQQSTKKDIPTKNGKPQAVDLSNTALSNNAWNGLKWTKAELWTEIQPGISVEKVIEILGPPSRTLQSLKPRVDKVFYYQAGLRKSTCFLQGKISFRKGKILSVEKPDFDSDNQIE